jgi:fatty-acyl-CoA synthase
VFAVPDAKYGEKVAVWVQLKEDSSLSTEDFRQFCEGQITHFKIPQKIRIVGNDLKVY